MLQCSFKVCVNLIQIWKVSIYSLKLCSGLKLSVIANTKFWFMIFGMNGISYSTSLHFGKWDPSLFSPFLHNCKGRMQTLCGVVSMCVLPGLNLGVRPTCMSVFNIERYGVHQLTEAQHTINLLLCHLCVLCTDE